MGTALQLERATLKFEGTIATDGDLLIRGGKWQFVSEKGILNASDYLKNFFEELMHLVKF